MGEAPCHTRAVPGPIPVSVIVMTKDEEGNLPKCLASVRDFAEVFVVDSASRDRTREIAVDHGARVVPFAWDGLYPKKKQWCLENLPFGHPWVLYVDADEEVTPPLAEEIRGLMAGPPPPHTGYLARYDYYFMGRLLRHGPQTLKTILFPHAKARFADLDDKAAGRAGEVELHFQPTIAGSVGTLAHTMVHREVDSLFHYFERHNQYSDWEAVIRSNGVFASTQRILGPRQRLLGALFARLPFKPLVAFVHGYLVQRGFRDGRAGFHFAVARAFYYWQIELKMRELAMSEPD